MKKLYKKREDGKLQYAEYWLYQNEITLHTGEVGKRGQIETFSGYTSEDDFEDYFNEMFYPFGYKPINKNYWIVVQYPTESIGFSDEINKLKNKVINCLNNNIGWLGLGHIDGFDIGKQICKNGENVLNIFCVVVDKNIGLKIINEILKDNNLNYEIVRIASKDNYEEDYILQYSFDKKEDEFFL
ncbi:MAG: hypothetical protein ACK5LC_06825 [Coprobacillaceae bacterium]